MFLNLHVIFTSAVESLFPNVWTFITHIVATLFLLCIIFFYAWKPTKEFLRKRKAFINKEIEQAKKSKDEAMLKLNEAEELKKKTFSEAAEFKKQAEIEMANFKQNVKQESEKSAQKIIDEANSYLLEQEKQLKKNYDQDVIDLSLEIASVLLNKKVDKKLNDELTDLIIKELKAKK